MIRGSIDVLVKQIEPVNDKIDRASFCVRVIGKTRSPDIPLEMHQIARRQVVDDVVAQCVFEADNRVPDGSWRRPSIARKCLKLVIDRQDKRFLIGFDRSDGDDGIP